MMSNDLNYLLMIFGVSAVVFDILFEVLPDPFFTIMGICVVVGSIAGIVFYSFPVAVLFTVTLYVLYFIFGGRLLKKKT